MFVYLQIIETEENKSKFEQIYLEYRDLMYHVALRYLRNSQDAEDAVHQAFVKIAENIQKILPPCPKTRGLAVVIVRNQAIDLWRLRKSRQQELLNLTADYELVEEGPGEESRLAACLLKLSEPQRQVLLLKYHYGYTLKEIARMLDRTLSWAQKTDQRAKKQLEKLMQEEGNEP